MIDFVKLRDAMADIEEDIVLDICKEVVESGEGVAEAISACQEGIAIVGDRFEQREYYIGDMIYAGEIMSEAMAIIKPLMLSNSGPALGKMILCTVEGDLHDIGKNIVKAMLEGANIEVIDMGIDVKPDAIVEKIVETGVGVLGMSGVLTLALDSMKATIEKLSESGLSDVKVIIGGAPVTETTYDFVNADAWAQNPAKTVKICSDWLKGNSVSF